MLVYRSTVAAAILYGALLVGCSAPEQQTDLRKDGPPNVTAVMVMSDLRTAVDPRPPGLSRLLESATYCRVGDEKRPGHVGLPDFSTTQVCPEDLSKGSETPGTAEGAPPNWFVRVVFDKLLDASVEDLVPVNMADPTGAQKGTLMRTQPVTLKCNGVDVPYDGYYAPGGSSQSWPPGPDLFITPLSAVGVQTGANCELSLKDIIHNKKGEAVPTDQRQFTFKIAPMRLRFSDPAPSASTQDGSFEQDVTTPVLFYWTGALRAFAAGPTDFPAAADIQIYEGTSAAICTAAVGTLTRVPDAEVSVDRLGATATTTALIMALNVTSGGMDLAWKPETFYRIEFGTGARVLASQGGPPGTFPANYKLCFVTSAAM